MNSPLKRAIFLWPLVLTVVAFVVVVSINTRIGFANGYSCDAWFFPGIDQDFFDTMKGWDGYQLRRYTLLIPWIYIAPHVDSVTLEILRTYFYFFVTAIAFFGAARKLYSPLVAAIALLLYCVGRLFLGAISSDYEMGANTAWVAVVIAATVHSAFSKRTSVMGVLCGLLCACALTCHLTTAYFLFPTPLLYFVSKDNWSREGVLRFVRYCLCYLAGIALGVVGWGLYSISVGMEFTYFMANINAGIHWAGVMRGMKLDLSWMLNDGNVHLILIVFFGGIATLASVVPRLRPENRTAVLASLVPYFAFIPVVIFLVIWETRPLLALNENVYSTSVYAGCFLALASLLQQFDWLRNAGWRTSVAVMAPLTAVIGWAAVNNAPLDQFTFEATAVAAVVCAASLLRRQMAGAAAFVGALAAFSFFVYPPHHWNEPWRSDMDWRRTYAQFDTAGRFIKSLKLPMTSRPRFWVEVNSAAPATWLLPRHYLWCNDYPAGFPDVSPPADRYLGGLPTMANAAGGYLRDGDVLVMVGSGHDLVARALPQMATLGYWLEPVAERVLIESPQKYSIAVARYSKADPAILVARARGTDSGSNIDLKGLNSDQWSPAKLEPVDGGVRLTSHPSNGGFSAFVAMPAWLSRPGPGRIKITATMERGSLLAWPSPQGDSSTQLVPRTLLQASNGDAVAFLDMPDLSKPIWIMFSNGSAEGASVAVIRSIEVLQSK